VTELQRHDCVTAETVMTALPGVWHWLIASVLWLHLSAAGAARMSKAYEMSALLACISFNSTLSLLHFSVFVCCAVSHDLPADHIKKL
jgi:hypothetical protein